MTYKVKLRGLLKEKSVVNRKITDLLCPIVSSDIIIVRRIPKTEKELSQCIKKSMGAWKHKWLDLVIIDISDKKVFIFGRTIFILKNLKKIAKAIRTDKSHKRRDYAICPAGLFRFNLGDFI